MSFSNFLENELLDHVFGGAAYSPPSSIYVKLHTGDPGENGTSNAAGETSRQQATFGTASGGTISNNADIEWTNVSNTETITHISLWDHASAGNCLGSGALTTPRALTAGDDFIIESGDLDVSLD